MQLAFGGAAEAGFEGAGDDLFERRIPGHGIGKFARGFRVGAAEFDGSWGAVAFGDAAIESDEAGDPVGGAGCGVEAVEGVLAGEGASSGAGADTVLVVDGGAVEAAGEG